MPPHRCRRCEAAPRRSKPLEAALPLTHSSFHLEAPRGARAFPRCAPPPLRFPVAGVDPLLRGPHRSKPHEVAQSSLITVEPAALNPSARPLHRARRPQSLEAAPTLAARRPVAVLDSKPRYPRPICLKPRHLRPILSKPRHPRQVRPKPRRGSVEVAVTRSRATRGRYSRSRATRGRSSRSRATRGRSARSRAARGQFVDAYAEPPPMTLLVISADPSTPPRRRRL
uniref:Uncharacterized protein n=1 Tax=Ananas comosus var. bracteatus TaxID=296719 RepID=A0A6V7NFA0_ANACO|nr:unnamed protein product [Ananas comosus var. bracteatus]